MSVKNIKSIAISNILILAMLIVTFSTIFSDGVTAATTENKGQWDFEYTGSSQEFIVPSDGNYRLETWGAEGGLPSDRVVRGGRGAYVEGVSTLKKGDRLNIYVGGQPINTNVGGFNGGGNGGISNSITGAYAGGGGGATDIRRDGHQYSDRMIVAGAGGGGGYYIKFRRDLGIPFAERRLFSGGGAGGKSIGQGAGTIGVNNRGEKAQYIESSTYGGGGGGQSYGGYGATNDINYGGRGLPGLGGSSIDEDMIARSSWDYYDFLGGGGGAGFYGGGARVTGYDAYNYAINGGGGSSTFNMLNSGTSTWANGWEAQPNPKGGTQVGNSGHGYVRITKSNDPPIVELFERAETDKNYHSDSFIRYSGTIKDSDGIGGSLKLYSEVVISESSSYGGRYKTEHGIFKNSMNEEYFSVDVEIPYLQYNNILGYITFWAEDSEGLKSEIFTTNIKVSRPKDIKIDISKSTESWVKGSYNVGLSVKSAENIKQITTSSGKVNITKSTLKEQEGYVLVSKNKPVTVRVTDIRNNVEEKTFYISNIQDLEVENLTKNSFSYSVDNWGDEYGIVEKDTQWELRNINSQTQSYLGSFSRRAENLKPNENIDVRYKLFNELGMELVTGWTNFESIYTLAEHPINAKINKVEKDRVLFDFNPSNENVNKPRYIFKAIEIPKENGSELSIQNSQIINEGEEVLIRNLKAETTYTLESATINGNEKQSGFKRMKDTEGNEVRFNTKGSLELDIRNLEDWNDATLEGTIKYNNETPLVMYIHIGSERIKISDDILKDSNSDTSFNINIKKGSKMTTARQVSKKEDAIKTYEVTTSQGDGQYDVYIETVVNKFSEEHQVGWFGLDHRGPESKSKAIFKRITKNQGILTLDKDNIRDISTSNHQITVDYGQGRMPLFSNKLITYMEPMYIRLYDKLGNVSNLDWIFDIDSSYKEGEDNNEIDPPEEKPTVNIDGSTVEIEVPNGGTHMQTSLDGVTWSMWEERRDKVRVALPTGDGMKSVFIRTGVETYKETPVYNVETFTIEMVKQKGGEISALNNIRVYKYIMDLTAPKLNVRTMDNSLIAINGNITILVDIVDNLDRTPEMTVEVFERDNIGNLKSNPLISKSTKIGEGKTTGTVPVSGLSESKKGDGKLQPYTLKVTAKDAHGNMTVEHLNFYVKNKK